MPMVLWTNTSVNCFVNKVAIQHWSSWARRSPASHLQLWSCRAACNLTTKQNAHTLKRNNDACCLCVHACLTWKHPRCTNRQASIHKHVTWRQTPWSRHAAPNRTNKHTAKIQVESFLDGLCWLQCMHLPTCANNQTMPPKTDRQPTNHQTICMSRGSNTCYSATSTPGKCSTTPSFILTEYYGP